MFNKNKTKQIIPVILILLFIFIFNNTKNNEFDDIENLYKSKAYNVLVTFEAQVVKKLKDDTVGSRHQKMILTVGKNTILLAHNIDQAPRVPVKENDTIIVKGIYEWNQKGGVVHWTHKKDNNPYGWIKHNNKKYQ